MELVTKPTIEDTARKLVWDRVIYLVNSTNGETHQDFKPESVYSHILPQLVELHPDAPISIDLIRNVYPGARNGKTRAVEPPVEQAQLEKVVEEDLASHPKWATGPTLKHRKEKTYIKAIVAKHGGMPYREVLDRFGITPAQYYRAVTRITKDPSAIRGKHSATIAEIISQGKAADLFDMGWEFIKEQYQYAMDSGIANARGVGLNEKNLYYLAYCALTYTGHSIPEYRKRIACKLASTNREEVLQALAGLNGAVPHLRLVLSNIRLGTIDTSRNGKHFDEAVYELFDKAFQVITGNPSLFDDKQSTYLVYSEGNLSVRRPAVQGYTPALLEKRIAV